MTDPIAAGRPRPGLPRAADRPRSRRRAVRVLVVDTSGPEDRLLLFRDSDPGLDPVPRWWITPGGGVDPGESDLQTAVRELAEETGQHVLARHLVGPLAARVVVHGYSDKVVTQEEIYYLVHLPAFEVDTSGHTDEERLTMTESRWWTRPEIERAAEDIWPRTLLQIWRLAHSRDARPVALPDSEESTVPA